MDLAREWIDAQQTLREVAGPAGLWVDQVMPSSESPAAHLWDL